MKPLDFLNSLPTPARMLFRPMLMISLVLHGVVLMLPIPSDLRIEQPKTSKQYKQVKIAQLPTTPSSPNSSPQSSAKPNPQPSPLPSQSTPAKLPTRPESSSELTPQPSQLTRPDPPTRPKPITTRRQSEASPIVQRKSIPQSEQQPKKEETQQQPAEQPERSQFIQEPTPSPSPQQPSPSPSPQQPSPSPSPQQPSPSPSTEEPSPSPSTEEPSPSPSPQQPSPSPSTEEQKPKPNEAGGGEYGNLFNQLQSSGPTLLNIALQQVEHDYQLKQFNKTQDINQLSESTKFKDTNGNPDTRFNFLQKAVSPLTTQNITSALEKQLNKLEFSFAKIGTYGGGPLYEVTKGDFKRYLIFAPGKNEQGDITAIIVSQDYPH